MATATPEPGWSGRDAVEILVDDHRRVEELFSRYEASTNADAQTRTALVDEMIRELSMHAAAEEQYFYPAVAKAVSDRRRPRRREPARAPGGQGRPGRARRHGRRRHGVRPADPHADARGAPPRR